MDKPKTKHCKECNRDLTLGNFRESHKGTGRLRSKCKSCENSKRNSSYEKKTLKPHKSKIHYYPTQKIEESSNAGRLIKHYSKEPIDLFKVMGWEREDCDKWDVGMRTDTGKIELIDVSNIPDFPFGDCNIAVKCADGTMEYQLIIGFVDEDGNEILYKEPLNGYRC
jgi:hypothetical protein